MIYRLWQQYSDVTAYQTPTREDVEADTYKDAIRIFCRKYGFKVTELESDMFWVEDRNGANMQYIVHWT